MAILLACLLVGVEREAQAYTDPGTGALIWQMIAAASIGGMFYFRRLWSSIARLWRNDNRGR